MQISFEDPPEKGPSDAKLNQQNKFWKKKWENDETFGLGAYVVNPLTSGSPIWCGLGPTGELLLSGGWLYCGG